MSLFETNEPQQNGLCFPQSLTEKYRPRAIADFIGLDKPKRLCLKLAEKPMSINLLFVGPSGTGKTTLALALADAIPAELHHIPSQDCTLDTIERVARTCNYVPMSGKQMHLVLVDEADQMSTAAQIALLSKLDSTAPCPNTIWIFTCNATDRLADRFMSRTHQVEFSSYGISKDATALLEHIWNSEQPGATEKPNFARIVKESNNNVRECLNKLETELLLA